MRFMNEYVASRANREERGMTLSPYEQWMVESNLQTIATTDVTPEEQIARLRANGYDCIADEVQRITAHEDSSR